MATTISETYSNTVEKKNMSLFTCALCSTELILISRWLFRNAKWIFIAVIMANEFWWIFHLHIALSIKMKPPKSRHHIAPHNLIQQQWCPIRLHIAFVHGNECNAHPTPLSSVPPQNGAHQTKLPTPIISKLISLVIMFAILKIIPLTEEPKSPN